MPRSRQETLAYAATNPFGVRVGQTYRSNDPRDKGRTITITRVEGAYAFHDKPGVVKTVRLDRFKPTVQTHFTLVPYA